MTKAHHPFASLLALLGALVTVLGLTVAPVFAAPPSLLVGPGESAVPGESVAVDNSADPLDPFHGDVYVPVRRYKLEVIEDVLRSIPVGEVEVFNSSGIFLRAFDVAAPSAVAVDESAGPSAGDVYVSNEARVEKFSPAGKLELTLKDTGASKFSGSYQQEGGQLPVQSAATLPVAVDASGNVWVGDRNRIEEFDGKGEYLSEVKVPDVGLLHGLAIDTDLLSPSSGDFYVSGSTPENEIQAIVSPASGSLALTFEGQTTAMLPFNANPAEIQGALEALSTIGAGNVVVTKGQTAGEPALIVHFAGVLSDTALPLISVSAGRVDMIQEGSPGHLLKLEPNGTEVGTLDGSGEPRALGLDPGTGDLFVVDTPQSGDNREHTLLEYGPSGAELEAFGLGEVLGEFAYPIGNALAFGDGAGILYVASSVAVQAFTLPPAGPLVRHASTEATAIGKTAVTLNATVNPEDKATTYHFQYITEQQFKEDGERFGAGTASTPQSSSIGEDFLEHPVSAAVAGLQFETTYRFRVIAANMSGTDTGEEATFTTLPPLRVDSTSSSDVTATSATLDAEINPLGEAATYRFEYLTEAAYLENGGSFSGSQSAVRAPQPNAALGSGEVDVEVNQHIQGLAPHTPYRYRVVGFDLAAPEGIAGTARTFTTQPVGGFGLLDGRGWELVSPPDKLGALLLPLSPKLSVQASVQAAAQGGAVTYVASASTEDGVVSRAQVTQVFSSRGGGGGAAGSSSSWRTRDLAVPQTEAVGVTEHPVFPLFSGDLARVAVQPIGPFDQSLSSLASEQTAYLYSDFAAGSSEACTSSCFMPLVTAANAPGVEFGFREGGPEVVSDQCPPDPFCGPQFEAASPDLEHVVVHSRAALTEGSPAGGGLFEFSGGALTFLGVGTVGAGVKEGGEISELSAGSDAVSADGSRVVIHGAAGGKTGLVLVDSVTGETLQLGGPEATFVTASVDDSRVFFENVQGGPLEECEVIEEPGGELKCGRSGKPLDLTPGGTGQAPVPGVSEDGSAIYFVSTGVLTGSERDPGGEAAVKNQPNLYLSQGGTVSLVAVLSAGDASDWGDSGYLELSGHGARSPNTALTELTARVSPDGRWLAFVSGRSLTGYDNQGATEVYLYHAATGGQPASVVCASCDPTGARPLGSASVPGWSTSLYQSRYLSDGGRLFFDSPDALVPQDTNNTEDVYEYEPPVGATPGEESPPSDSCTTSTPTYSTLSQGCVDLVSSGTSPEASSFLDASENGDDVFFLTAAEISKRDTDTSYDVYDAHVNGSEPEPARPIECQGDACQSPAQAPSDLTPGSLTFSGPGNFVVASTPPAKKKTTENVVKCKRGFAKKHNKCVKSKKKKTGATKAKQTNRRAK